MKEPILYKIIRPILTVGFKILFLPKIIGKENIPKNGRVIMAGNHTHIFDCALVMCATKRPIHFLAKCELWHGFKGILFSHMGLIPVDRKNKNHNALLAAYKYLNSDCVVGIFPEGTTSKGELLSFKIGAVKMAHETNSKIVPFVITPNYHLFKRPKIEFLKSISISDDLEKENERLYNLIDEKRRNNNE